MRLKSLPYAPCRITSGFGKRNTGIAGATIYHQGIDIGVNKENPSDRNITAVLPGRVQTSTYNATRGWYVVIDHGVIEGNNVITLYQHLRSKGADVGRIVKEGEQIGIMGATGTGGQLHLHFEVRINGKPVDPEPYIHSFEKGEDDMTEAEVRKIVKSVLAEELSGKGKPASDWAKKFWEARTADGTVDGTRPQGYATREEIATMLSKRLGGK